MERPLAAEGDISRSSCSLWPSQSGTLPSADDRVPWELSSKSPVSICADKAWDVTLGSPSVTIAIIDESFDESWLAPGAVFEKASAARKDRASHCSHGTLLAGLIVGNRCGYPGVAPQCRLLGIELPSRGSDEEEAKAFEVALAANAAVVCCGWGPPFRGRNVHRPIPPNVAYSIDQLARQSRNGLGAIVFFAVGSNGADGRLDGYVSHPTVTAVSGITRFGRIPESMDSGRKVTLFAPVSDGCSRVGGKAGVPAGASAATGLAAGIAGLMFSANSLISAAQAASILNLTAAPVVPIRRSIFAGRETPSHPARLRCVINAAEAVKASLDGDSLSVLSAGPLEEETSIEFQRAGGVTEKERRFGGGEHSTLGDMALRALRNQYNAFRSGTVAFFEDIFTEYTPSRIPNWGFDTSILNLFGPYFLRGSLNIPNRGFFQCKYLVGLSADVYDCPQGLLRALRVTPSEAIDAFTQDFDEEIKNPKKDSDIDLFLRGSGLPAWLGGFGSPEAHAAALAVKNISHFVGENLLSYLSYHLLAVNLATECYKARTVPDVASFFVLAVITEAFAAHFLSDMFSAGHARVPRRAILDSYGPRWANLFSLTLSQQVSQFLHQYEGELGVFFTNSLGYIWYAFGDKHLLDPRASGVYTFANGSLSPLLNGAEPLNIGRLLQPTEWDSLQNKPLRPQSLVATLVFASLADVIRHMATDFRVEASAQGAGGGSGGLLGYVLDRIPYALPTTPFPPALEGALRSQFDRNPPSEAWVSKASLIARLQDVDKCFEVISGPLMAPPLMFTEFEDVFQGYHMSYLTPDKVRALALQEASHLAGILDPQLDAKFLSTVPSLISEHFVAPDTDATYHCGVDAVSLPDNWKDAVRQTLKTTPSLINMAGGVWGLGE